MLAGEVGAAHDLGLGLAGDGAAWHKRNDGSAYPFFEPEHRPQTVMAGADISMSADASAEPKPVSGYSYFVVGFLAVVYTLNFLDRQIISILGKQISAELHLTKTQFGLLGGTSFALLYTTCGVGVAYLADRVSRKWIIALACAIWSLFTALCGTAQNFLQILFYRMGVGFGEASGSPPHFARRFFAAGATSKPVTA